MKQTKLVNKIALGNIMIKYFLIALVVLNGCKSTAEKEALHRGSITSPPMDVSISEPGFAGAPELMLVTVSVQIKKNVASVQLYNVFLDSLLPQPANLYFVDSEGKKSWAYQIGFSRFPSAQYWTYLRAGNGINTTYTARVDATKLKPPVIMKLVIFKEMENLCPNSEEKMKVYNKRYALNQMNEEPWVESNEITINSFK